MRYHGDLFGLQNPVVMDFPVYDASDIVEGQGLTYGATVRGAVLIDCVAAGTDFFGVAQETVTASTTAITTGTLVYCKVIVDPFAIYLTDMDMDDADIDVVSSTSTATTLGTVDDDMDGGWLYINSGTGAGQIAYIGAATTTVMTLDTTTAWTTTPDSTSDAILLRRILKHPADSGIDLDATFVRMEPGTLTQTGSFVSMENYIGTVQRPFAPLRPRQHHMAQNLNNNGIRLASDLYPVDHLLRGASTFT